MILTSHYKKDHHNDKYNVLKVHKIIVYTLPQIEIRGKWDKIQRTKELCK